VKILLLSQFFSSTRGGGEHLFYIMAKKLADNDHQVWVITNKIKDEVYLSHKNIKIILVPPVLKYQGGLPPSIKDNVQYFLNSVRTGLNIIRKNNIEIIHSNNFTPALVGSLLSFLTSKVHITSVWDIFTLCGCDYWEKWVKQVGISKINQIIGPIFEKLVLKTRCDAFHTISDASKYDLVKYGAKKPIYMFPPAIEDIQDEKIIQNNKQFIYIGRLVFYKNVEILIRAINIVRSKEKEVKLIIVGGGPHIKTIQEMITNLHLENNVTTKGYLDTKEKFQLISESNALLFPSLCEGFGLVILEAFSQKRPVLTSNIPPMSDIIENQKTGYLVDPHDENEWAEKIIKLINEPEVSQKMGEDGYKVLKEEYNQETFYQNLVNMYQSVL